MQVESLRQQRGREELYQHYSNTEPTLQSDGRLQSKPENEAELPDKGRTRDMSMDKPYKAHLNNTYGLEQVREYNRMEVEPKKAKCLLIRANSRK